MLDLALVVDGSGSICENDLSYANGKCDNWRAVINFLADLVNVMDIDGGKARVGLVLFSTDAEVRWSLGT